MCKLSNGSCALVIVLVFLIICNLLLLANFLYQTFKSSFLDREPIEIENLASDVPHNRITNSKKLPIVNYKFIAAVLVLHHSDRYDTDMVICGASIISRYWVMTAAHCAEILIEVPIEKMRIASNSTLWQNGVWHKIRRIVVHEKYDGLSLANDISLISVTDPFTGMFENPIAIASQRYKYVENSDITVIGWSASKYNVFGLDLQMFPDKHCRSKYTQLGTMNDAVFCAGSYKRRMSCVFDFGGPVIQKNVLIGIVSYRGDCERDKPGIYTKVGMFESWIKYIEKRYSLRVGAKYV